MEKILAAAEINDIRESVMSQSLDTYDLRLFDFTREVEKRVIAKLGAKPDCSTDELVLSDIAALRARHVKLRGCQLGDDDYRDLYSLFSNLHRAKNTRHIPTYYRREIGETGWSVCSKSEYDYAKNSPQLDTKVELRPEGRPEYTGSCSGLHNKICVPNVSEESPVCDAKYAKHQELLVMQLRRLGDNLSLERHTVRVTALDAADEIEALNATIVELRKLNSVRT